MKPFRVRSHPEDDEGKLIGIMLEPPGSGDDWRRPVEHILRAEVARQVAEDIFKELGQDMVPRCKSTEKTYRCEQIEGHNGSCTNGPYIWPRPDKLSFPK